MFEEKYSKKNVDIFFQKFQAFLIGREKFYNVKKKLLNTFSDIFPRILSTLSE